MTQRNFQIPARLSRKRLPDFFVKNTPDAFFRDNRACVPKLNVFFVDRQAVLEYFFGAFITDIWDMVIRSYIPVPVKQTIPDKRRRVF
ncbi:MAG: hypothetical protein MI892_10815 [Desulfobacterales bacterium]|nr:hypothetical protein [Desulfobacterales bacterium]